MSPRVELARRGRALAAWLAISSVVACSASNGETEAATRSAPSVPASSGTPAAPIGIVAIGHSGLTGYASDPGQMTSDQFQNSWATGTNPAVNSIYERLIAIEPDIRNHVANTAIDGSKVTALTDELTQAFNLVPSPQLVIIQTIDNDIDTCDVASARIKAAQFGSTLRRAIDSIIQRSPQTKILTMAQFGRPTRYVKAIKPIPAAVDALSGDGACDFFSAAGVPIPAHIAATTKVVGIYEAQVSRVCAQIAQCRYTDASARYVDRLENLVAGDWNHPSVAGQAAWAALMWPVVADLLGLPAK